MQSEKLMRLLLISFSICGIVLKADNNCCTTCNTDKTKRCVVEVANRGKRPVIATQAMVVPTNTKATITTELERLESSNNNLHQAIMHDSAEEVRRVVREGANVNQLKDGKAPIWWAMLLRKANAVDALLDCGASADQKLVEYALMLNEIRMAVSIVLKRNLNLDALYFQNETLLYHALTGLADPEVAYLLVNRGATLDLSFKKSVYGSFKAAIYTWLCVGSEKQREFGLKILEYLIKHAVDVNEFWNSDMGNGLLYCSPEMARLLLEDGANPNYVFKSQGLICTPLFSAINSNSVECIRILLDAGADVNQRVGSESCLQTPLSYAVTWGISGCCSTGCRTSCPTCCTTGRKVISQKIVELLLEHGASL